MPDESVVFEVSDDLESDPELESDDLGSDDFDSESDFDFFEPLEPLEGVEEVLLSFRYQPEPLK